MRAATKVRDQHLMLNDLRFHYRDWGDPEDPPLVLIHGSGLCARAYDGLAGGLADRHRVLTLDMRGHGETDRAADYQWERAFEDLAAFIEALDLAPLSMIGHSMGARMSAAYAARNPDAVQRLVLIDWVPDAQFTTAYAQALRQLFGTPRIDDPERVLQGAKMSQPRLRESEFRHVIQSSLAPHPAGGWTWRLDPEVLRGRDQAFPIPVLTSAALVQQIHCPTLLIRAAESQYVTREQAERMVGALCDGRLIEIPESGHGLPWEQPESLLQAVQDYLTEQRPAAMTAPPLARSRERT